MLSTIKTELLMGIFTYSSRQKFFFSTMVFLSGLLSVWAQCPTVNDATPSFCDSQDPRVSNLNAFVTDGGAGIAWYADPVGGTALISTARLENGVKYYVDQTSGNCGGRVPVDVTIISRPTIVDNQDPFWPFCLKQANEVKTLQDGIDKNIILGSNLKYYDGQFATANLLQPDYQLKDNEIIWVSQTNLETGCESIRRSVRVNFDSAIPPIFEAEQFFCYIPENPPTLLNVDVGLGNTFYRDATTDIPTDPSVEELKDGDVWYITTNNEPCESERVPLTVRLDQILQPEPSEPLEYCINNIAQNNVNLFDQFTVKPAQTGTWSTTALVSFADPNDFNGNINLSTLTEGSHTFTYTVPSINDCPDQVNTVTVNIVPLPNAGEDGTANFCTAGAAEDLFTYLLPKNEVAPEAGGTWTFNGNPHSGTFDPLNDIAGVYTYTVEKTPCDPDTATVTVTTDSQVKIGSGNTLTYCETKLGSIPVVNLFSEIVGETDTNGVWTNDSRNCNGRFRSFKNRRS
jgi:hypothetical protein